MKVVHVTDCFLPRLGGIEIQVSGLAAAQVAAGHDVAVITATPSGEPGEPAGPPGVPVHHVVAGLPFELPVHPRAGHHLTARYRELRPDVVHVHVGAVSPFGWAAARAAVRAGIPAVVTVHSMWGSASRALYRGLQASHGWCEWPVVVTAVSEAAAMLVRQATAGRAEVRVVPNGIDLPAWRQRFADRAPRAESGGDPGVHVVAVGRLAPRKQPLRLLHLLRAARRRVPADVPLRATIAGDGPARPAMERYLRAHRLDWITLAGRLDQPAVHDLLATADVFVAPAKLESFGLAALEARIAGLPVLGRSSSGLGEFVVDGADGLLCDSTRDLLRGLVRLCVDAELRARIAAHNRAVLPVHCDWPAVTGRLDRCYATARARHLAVPRPRRPLVPLPRHRVGHP